MIKKEDLKKKLSQLKCKNIDDIIIKDSNVKDYNINDLHLNYNHNSFKPYISNIGKFEYHKLAKNIYDSYKNVKYNDFIISFYKEIIKIKEETLMVPNDNMYLNYLMLYYTQCRPNVKISTLFSKKNQSLEEIVKKFNNVDLFASKVIKLNFKSLKNLIYQMYIFEKNFKEISEIETFKKIGYNKWRNYTYLYFCI